MNLLPITIRIGKSGFPVDTTYFDTEMCSKGFYYLVHSNYKYFLLLPKWNDRVIREMETGKSVVITRGNYKGKDDCFEVMFDDGSDNPYMIMLEDEQFTRISPLQEGWNGLFYVYSGDLDEYKLYFSQVYYRIADNLPCLLPVEEQAGKLHNLTPLSNDEVMAKIKPLFDSTDFPLLHKKFDLDTLVNQLVAICEKTGRKILNTNFEVILTQLEKSLK
jgi:hypothetical protein